MSTVLRILSVANAATFFLGAIAHTGFPIPLGFATIAEPRIIPATIVEGLCGAAFAVAAYGTIAHRPWGWRAALAAHLVGLGGVLLGMAALAAGRGPRTETNDIYHQVMIVLLIAGLVLLSRRGVKTELAPAR